jgi:hypothetical protein
MVYAETHRPLSRTLAGRPTFREINRGLDATGTDLSFDLKIEEITKNHRNSLFCLYLVTDDGFYITEGFRVRTKRTKSKKNRSTRGLVSTDFKRRAKEVLTLLEWRLTGYEREQDGSADYDRPVYTCPLCREHRDVGHTSACGLQLLLEQ